MTRIQESHPLNYPINQINKFIPDYLHYNLNNLKVKTVATINPLKVQLLRKYSLNQNILPTKLNTII